MTRAFLSQKRIRNVYLKNWIKVGDNIRLFRFTRPGKLLMEIPAKNGKG